MKLKVTIRFIIIMLCLVSAYSHAAVLLVDPSGQLIGAREIVANDLVFSVRFASGSSANVNGLSIANSGYYDPGDAVEADNLSSALFDQVFVDLAALPPIDYRFDTNARLTYGCSDVFACYILTPYADDPFDIYVSMATNTPGADFVDSMRFGLYDEILFAPYIIAQWTFDPYYDQSDVLPGTRIVNVGFDQCLGDLVCAAQVPEPNAAALVFIGLFGLFLARCCHRREGA